MLYELIKKTQETFGYEFKVQRNIQEAFIRDIKILNKYHYCLLNSIIYQDNKYIYYYSFLFDSCLRLLITSENIEWFWAPKQVASESKIQDIVDTTFPQILFPLDTEIESLINFADKIYQRGNIILLIDPDGVILNAGELNLVHKILNEINSSSIGTTKNLNIFGKKDSNNYGFRVESKNCLEYQDILKQQEIVKLDDVILPENSRNLVKLNVTFTDLIIILFIVLIRTLFSGTLVGIVAAPIMCIACAFFALLLGVYINIYFIALIFIFTFIFAYYTLFETLYNEEITKKKIIILSRQISDQPNNLQLFFQRGYAYLSIEKYDIAMGDFNRFIEIQPANIAAYYSIIFEYEKKRKYDNCLIFCKKLIQNIPQYHEIYLKMAELKCKKGESKSAILDLDSFLKLNFRNI